MAETAENGPYPTEFETLYLNPYEVPLTIPEFLV
jgi:hypothetical protein